METTSSRLLYREIISGLDAGIECRHLTGLFRDAFHQNIIGVRPAGVELFCQLIGLLVFDRKKIGPESLVDLISSNDAENCKLRFETDPSDFYNLLLYAITLLLLDERKRGLHLLDRLCRSGWGYRDTVKRILKSSQRWSHLES